MTEKTNDGIQLDELSCVVCQEPFGEGEFTPRILTCGHTFCTRCLKILIKSRNFCPDCRTPISFKEIHSVPIVYIVKKISHSITELNRAISKNELDFQVSQDCNISEKFSEVSLLNSQSKYPSVGTCQAHEAPQQFWCESCQKWICGTCIFIEHGQSYSQDCRILLATSQFIRLKEKEILKIVTQELALESAGQTLTNFYDLVRLEFLTVASGQETDSSCHNYEYLLNILSEKMDELKRAYKKMDDARQKMNVNSLKQLKSTSNMLCNVWGGKKFPQTREELLYGIWTEIVNKVPEAVLKAENMTTLLHQENSQSISLIYTKNGYLVVPSLSTQHTPGKFVIPFNELRKKRSGLRTFLTLSHKGKAIGTIQIIVNGNSWGEHFISLCTGERGKTYKGTKFFYSGGLFTKYIAGGDYEYNSGRGGRKISDVYDTCDGNMRNGIICGDKAFSENTVAQFKIYYEVGSSPFASNPIGYVEYGIDLVRRISKEMYKEVVIAECGILLPLTKEHGSYCDI